MQAENAGEIWYKRANKLIEIVNSSTTLERKEKANKLFNILMIRLVNISQAIKYRDMPKPNYPDGGVETSYNVSYS